MTNMLSIYKTKSAALPETSSDLTTTLAQITRNEANERVLILTKSKTLETCILKVPSRSTPAAQLSFDNVDYAIYKLIVEITSSPATNSDSKRKGTKDSKKEKRKGSLKLKVRARMRMN
jgi:hypothetical protein